MSSSGSKLLDNSLPFDEDAAVLNFGEEYQNAQPLFLAEAKMLMEAQVANKPNDKVFTDVFDKTLVHLKRFNRLTRPDTVREMRRVLSHTALEPFEQAQIASLNIEDVELCKALIPSVGSGMDDEELNRILIEAASVKRFQA